MKYEFGILLAATNNSAFTIGTMLVNIMDKMQNEVDIFYILHDGFNDNDKNLMAKIISKNPKANIKFIEFTSKNFLDIICKYANNYNLELKSITILNRYTHMAFARFEAFKFLNECKSIVYLDFDMLLLKNISELKNSYGGGDCKNNQNKFDFAICKGSANLAHGLGRLCPKGYENLTNYATGILCFYDNIKQANSYYDFIYTFIANNFDDFFTDCKLPDQAIFSYMIFKKNLKVYELESEKYYGNISWVKSKDSSIIHAWGQNNRFWNNKLVCLSFPSWRFYYQKWLDMGGSAYTDGYKAYTNVPLYAGEVFQFFERIEFAKRIIKIKDDEIYLILDANFNNKLKFYLSSYNENEFIYIYSNSINNFIIEYIFNNTLQDKLIIKRNELETKLLDFIRKNLNKNK